MAEVVDHEQPVFKHHCRICKKGFGCGRALGGHMRAHGIGDENLNLDDDDGEGDWHDNQPPGTKRMYALRTNTNRNKSTRTCENCGKEFSSWKSFLEHGRCTSADGESLVSSPCSDDEETPRGWSKGKRSRRAKLMGTLTITNCASSEEEDLANCLVMLSNARVESYVIAETEESCASASKDEEEQRRNTVTNNRVFNENIKAKGVAANKGLFECKACKKVFNSHQALGGHRASHKKVKGCFASKLDDVDDSVVEEDVITNDDYFSHPSKSTTNAHQTYERNHHQVSQQQPTSTIPSKRKSKVHECSICHRVFSSGQALGGHKRCHWLTSSNSPDATSIVKFHSFQDPMTNQNFHLQRPKLSFNEPLDLNLPAPAEENGGNVRRHYESRPKLSFEMSTEIYLQPPWIGVQTTENNNEYYYNRKIHEDEDEAESKVKLAKLSDLKDINMGGGTNPWLQVGLGPSTSTHDHINNPGGSGGGNL